MRILPLVLFALTYLGLAFGRVPGLRLDRTGIALLGAVAFLLCGEVTFAQAAAAVDAPTVGVLFGMMLLSAEYRFAGLYDAIGRRLAAAASPRRLLAATIAAAALLSAVFTNDVICFALAPLLAGSLLRSRRDPLPFLLALACASNLGSGLTPIGNPQNILIAQRLGLAFLPFVLACAAPVALSLGLLYLLLPRRVGSGVPAVETAPAARLDDPAPPAVPAVSASLALDRPRAIKAIALTAAAIALFLSPIPAPWTALAIGAVVLLDRRVPTRRFLAEVDWQLLALFVGLFVVVRGLELSGWTQAARGALAAAHLDLAHPAVLAAVVSVLSNLVSNVPAVMLLLPFVPHRPAAGYLLALASTFAGNALLVGSIANLIVAEQSERLGIPFRFRDHLAIAALAAALW
jgi:Na+/H+ antiporter NhaD/arsenite permease-like protein